MSLHEHCTHATIGTGAVYCPWTCVVYVRPDMIATEKGRKVRGDEADVFSRRVRQIVKAMSGITVKAYALLVPTCPLPRCAQLLPDHIAMRQYLDRQRKERAQLTGEEES